MLYLYTNRLVYMDERYVRKVKYGLVLVILLGIQFYLWTKTWEFQWPNDLAFYNLFMGVNWIFIAYIGIRFVIIMLKDSNRFLDAIDILLTRVIDGMCHIIYVLMKPSPRVPDNTNRIYVNQRVDHYHHRSKPQKEYDPFSFNPPDTDIFGGSLKKNRKGRNRFF